MNPFISIPFIALGVMLVLTGIFSYLDDRNPTMFGRKMSVFELFMIGALMISIGAANSMLP